MNLQFCLSILFGIVISTSALAKQGDAYYCQVEQDILITLKDGKVHQNSVNKATHFSFKWGQNTIEFSETANFATPETMKIMTKWSGFSAVHLPNKKNFGAGRSIVSFIDSEFSPNEIGRLSFSVFHSTWNRHGIASCQKF